MTTRPSRYTTYVGGGANPAHALLATLFPKGPFADPLSNGDETKAQASVLKVATSDPGADPNGGGLQPKGGVQAGDLGMFPQGVDLTFSGKVDPKLSAPDVDHIKWVNPGDPANGRIPDVTSPTAGPGHIQGTDKTADPSGTIPQIVTESTSEDPSGQGIRNPSAVGNAIAKNNVLLQPQAKGDSGGNV